MSKPFVAFAAVCLLVGSGCSIEARPSNAAPIELGSQKQASKFAKPHADGEDLFFKPLRRTNGRACGTCHVKDDHLALKPERVKHLLAQRPKGPLFNRIDADDPRAVRPKYEHLKKGLVRVKLHLPPNVELLSVPPDEAAFFPEVLEAWKAQVAAGNIPEVLPQREIEVWRAVPSLENLAYTAPFLFDGRAHALEDQAFSALVDHSAFKGRRSNVRLKKIADFERTIFSDEIRAEYVADQIRSGVAIKDIGDPERLFPPTNGMTAQQLGHWENGKRLYDQVCAGCHGSATDNLIVDRSLHDAFFLALDSGGNVIFAESQIPVIGDDGKPVIMDGQTLHEWRPQALPAAIIAHDEFLRIATSLNTYLGQVTKVVTPGGFIPSFVSDVTFPRYRMRFHNADGTTVDLPPLPVITPFNPEDPEASLTPVADPNPRRVGAFIAGPNLVPQLWTPDPGRAAISGNYWDFEAFDVPQLRGIAHTAPYFHDNHAATLRDVVDFYSGSVFPFVAPLIGMGDRLTSAPVAGIDLLTDEEKADLVVFLEVF